MRWFRIARVFGVDVVGDASLIALGTLLSWVIYLELRLPGQGNSSIAALVGAAVGGVLFLATVLAHELSHTAVAQRRGHTVKRIRLMVFGGASELEDDSMSAATEAAVAIVGPVTSAILGGGLIAFGLAVDGALGGAARFVGLANLALAVFNLLPGLPLDGGRVLRAMLWRITGDRDRATHLALQSGRYVGLVLVGVGVFLAIRSMTSIVGIWVVFVGWFLTRMAATAGRGHRLDIATRGKTVGDAMRRVHESVAGSLTVAEALDLHQIGPTLRALVVEAGGRAVGILGQFEVDQIAPELRGTTPVGAAMTRIGPADVADIDTKLMTALQRDAGATRHIVVTEGGRVVGLISGAEVADLLST